MNDLYQEMLLEHYKYPLNRGVLSGEKNNHNIVKNSNVGCGDAVEVLVQLHEDEKHIEKVRWQGDGCVISMAGMSVISEFVKGKTVDEVVQLNKEKLLELLGMDEITLAREKCLLLGLQTIQRAIKEYA